MTSPPANRSWFGKLPCLGDFCSYNMPERLQATLDEWLSVSMQTGMARHSTAWMQAYFKTPIHGFIWHWGVTPTPGIIGVFMPSVDRAGRAFPFLLLEHLSGTSLRSLCAANAFDWFALAHKLCADALLHEWPQEQLLKASRCLPDLNAQRLFTPEPADRLVLPHSHSEWYQIEFGGACQRTMHCSALPDSAEFELLMGLNATR